MNAHIIIHHATVMTMEGPGVGMLTEAAVAIKENQIVAVGKTEDVLRDYQAHTYIDGKNKLVMPGLIDAHIHTGISIVRGVAQDMSNWMHQGIWPYMKHMTQEDALAGSLMNIVEGLKAGTTTFVDYDDPMHLIVEHYARVGARARVASMINEMPADVGLIPVGELYPLDRSIGERKIQENIQLFEKWHEQENGRITCLFGPQGPDMLSQDLLLEVKQIAEKYDTRLHMHVAQGDREIYQMVKRYGKRSIQYLDEIGYLNDRLIAVHLTEATKEETELVAKRGASLIYCAGSIGIIDGLVPPVYEFIEAGGTAGLGSDQAPGNNCNNMFNEMKFAAILNKVKRQDPRVFPAWMPLRMATIEAAKAIGLDDEVGSLAVGKKADIIIIDMEQPNLTPVLFDPIRNIVPNLVYSAKGNEVETVIIDGQIVMENRVLKTIDEKEVIRQAQQAATAISERAKDDIETVHSDVYQMMKDGYL